MSAIYLKPDPLRSKEFEDERSLPAKSAATMLVELGVAIARVQSGAPMPGQCCLCHSRRSPRSSTAEFPNVFCSEECEQEFVRAALASLTLEDCIRMHQRLENLAMRAEAAPS